MVFTQLPDESVESFSRLIVHRDQGPSRSFRVTAGLVGCSESTLRRLSDRWNWTSRLRQYDRDLLQLVSDQSSESAQIAHRMQLEAFRDTTRHRSECLIELAEEMMALIMASTRVHLDQGNLLQPGQLGAAITSAGRALELSGSTIGTALGVDELLTLLDHEG